MKKYINRVQLLGHLGQDPEVKPTSNSTLVKLRIATNESYKDKKGEYQDYTQWHTLVAWGKLAENMADKLRKGSHLLVNGKLSNSQWEGKDGAKRYSTEVLVRDYIHLNKPKGGASAESTEN